MKKLMILLLSVVIFAGCKDPGGSSSSSGSSGGSWPKAATENSGFGAAVNPGDTGILTVDTETVNMHYTQNQDSILFPVHEDDSSTQTLTTKSFMSETEVTNAVVAAVLQWAYGRGYFNTTNSGAHNYLSTTTAKHGGQELLDLDYSHCKINYAAGQFTVDNGYDDHPVVSISWYGAVMFCNWLTEMRDGNAANVVHKWVDDGSGGGTANDGIWQHGETTEDVAKNGYRLPRSYEWEYAARYRSDNTNTVMGYANPSYTNGNSASDATADYNNANACKEVAWYSPNSGGQLHPVKGKRANDLELFDMSGNVWEWCFTRDGSHRVYRGGSWFYYAGYLQVGYVGSDNPQSELGGLGFRLCRTR